MNEHKPENLAKKPSEDDIKTISEDNTPTIGEQASELPNASNVDLEANTINDEGLPIASKPNAKSPSAPVMKSSGEVAPELKPGQVIGKCTIIKELGRGGMGAVYKGRHRTLDVDVAIKVLPPHVAGRRPEYSGRFMREGQLAARIKHQNVMTVMDADVCPETGMLYMVLEYVDGGSLRELLNSKPMSEKRALEITACVADALIVAEKLNVIHRDIKPENIMLTSSGVVKLADLGLAKDTADDSAQATMSDHVMGTPSYMSPEQAKSTKDVDSRADIYSLGATLYHMLINEPPFTAESTYGILTKIATEPTPDPRKIRKDISEETSKLCLKMMAKKPENRYQTAEELHEAINNILHARPASPLPAKPSNYSVVIFAACLVIIVAIYFIAGRQPPQTDKGIQRGIPTKGEAAGIEKNEQVVEELTSIAESFDNGKVSENALGFIANADSNWPDKYVKSIGYGANEDEALKNAKIVALGSVCNKLLKDKTAKNILDKDFEGLVHESATYKTGKSNGKFFHAGGFTIPPGKVIGLLHKKGQKLENVYKAVGSPRVGIDIKDAYTDKESNSHTLKTRSTQTALEEILNARGIKLVDISDLSKSEQLERCDILLTGANEALLIASLPLPGGSVPFYKYNSSISISVSISESGIKPAIIKELSFAPTGKDSLKYMAPSAAAAADKTIKACAKLHAKTIAEKLLDSWINMSTGHDYIVSITGYDTVSKTLDSFKTSLPLTATQIYLRKGELGVGINAPLTAMELQKHIEKALGAKATSASGMRLKFEVLKK